MFLKSGLLAFSIIFRHLNGISALKSSVFRPSSPVLIRLKTSRLNDKRDEKIIDAEIVNEKSGFSKSSLSNNRSAEGGKTPSRPGGITGLVNSVGNAIGSFFGIDRESQIKRERKKELNTSIDKMLQGTGKYCFNEQ
jgi:hypothetical protein